MSPIKPNPLQVPQKTLRRLVSRAQHVAAQYESNPVLRVAAVRVVPRAQAFEEAYDACRNVGIQRARSVERCHAHARTLGTHLRAWVGVLASELGFDPAEFTPESSVPADIVAAAHRFIAFLESQSASESAAQPAEALTVLKEAANLTEAEWTEAQRAAAQVQTMEQTMRDRAVEFHEVLVVFRRALATVIGRRHVDYQTLRYRRAPQGDETPEVVMDDGVTATGSSGQSPDESGNVGRLPLEEVAAE